MDAPKTAAELIADFATNNAHAITAAQLRNLVESIVPAIGRFSMTIEKAIDILDTADYYEVVPAGGISGPVIRNFTYADGRLTYTGAVDIHVHVAVTLSMDAAENAQVVNIRVAKNADPDEVNALASETDQKQRGSGEIGSTAMHYDGMMSTGDFLSIFVRNESSATVVTMRHMYFFILGMMDVSGL